jgi:hypothetical protein
MSRVELHDEPIKLSTGYSTNCNLRSELWQFWRAWVAVIRQGMVRSGLVPLSSARVRGEEAHQDAAAESGQTTIRAETSVIKNSVLRTSED